MRLPPLTVQILGCVPTTTKSSAPDDAHVEMIYGFRVGYPAQNFWFTLSWTAPTPLNEGHVTMMESISGDSLILRSSGRSKVLQKYLNKDYSWTDVAEW